MKFLSEYDFEITYIKGTVNRVADALSWRPCIFSVLPFQTNLREKILTLQHDDDWYKEVEGFIGQNTMMVSKFEGFTFDKLMMLMLREAHKAVYMAHLRVMKMRVDLKPLFFWKEMNAYIVNYVAKCLECQQVKVEHKHPT